MYQGSSTVENEAVLCENMGDYMFEKSHLKKKRKMDKNGTFTISAFGEFKVKCRSIEKAG